MLTRIRRAALAACATGLVATALLAAVGVGPASAYGKANWQLTFHATATLPGGGGGFGFWGWCDLAGGVTSGTSGDCQVTQYGHSPGGGGFTCHENINLTAWTSGVLPPDPLETFLISGTATVVPASLTGPCLSIFPGSSPFGPVDSGIPAAPGHYDFGVSGIPGGAPPGSVGEYNVQVNQVP